MKGSVRVRKCNECRAILLGLVLGISSLARAGDPFEATWIHRHWGTADGLPSASVNGLVQDEDGFIWIATFAGLARFDGIDFEVIRNSEDTPLPSNRLTTLLRSPDDDLWMSTEPNDIVRVRDGVVHHVGVDDGLGHELVVRVAQSPEGWLAYGTRDGVSLITANGITPLHEAAVQGETRALIWPDTNVLWVATTTDLVEVRSPSDEPTIRRWPVDFLVRSMVLRGETLWLGGEDGLFRLSEAGVVRHLGQVIGSSVSKLEVAMDGAVIVDDGEMIWRVTDDGVRDLCVSDRTIERSPLLIPDGRGGELLVAGSSLRQDGRSVIDLDHEIVAGFTDREGSVWLGTAGGGLHQLRRSSVEIFGPDQGLSGEAVYPVFRSEAGEIWLGVNGSGAMRVDRDGSIYEIRGVEPVWSIAEIDGEIWLAGNRVCRVNLELDCVSDGLEHLAGSEPFRLIYRDREGRIWLAGRHGTMWIRERSEWRLLSAADGWSVEAPIRTVAELDSGELWFGTNGEGVVRFVDNHFEVLGPDQGFDARLVRSILPLSSSEILIGTEDRGVCRIHLDQGFAVPGGCIGLERGLGSVGAHHMELDDGGRLWWSSDQGIFWQQLQVFREVFDESSLALPAGGRFAHHNGLPNAEANGGVYPGGTFDQDGYLLFPTQYGVVRIDPDVADLPVPPVVARVATVQIGSVILDGPFTAPVILQPRQRSLLVVFGSTSFTDPERTEFSYRMPRSSPHWTDLGTHRRTTISHLEPGKATLEIRARNTGGTWQVDPTRLELVAPSLWWERRAIQALLALFVAGIVWRLFAWQGSVAMTREASLQAKVDQRTAELREVYARRSEYFVHINHELRTPLTLLHGPVEDAFSRGRSLEGEDLVAMVKSTRLLKRLVDQILDLEKIEAQAMELWCQPVRLSAFLESCVEPFRLLTKQLGLEIHVRDAPAVTVEIDESQFEKVVANLLSNAVKVAPVGSTIEVVTEVTDEVVRVSVLDQGPGFPPGAEGWLFERFCQGPSSLRAADSGSGLGLALVKQIVGLHGGVVEASNRPGGGACLQLELPLSSRVATDTEPLGPSPIGDSTAMELGKASAEVTILVVEDNQDLRDYIGRTLESQFRTIMARDGEQGLRLARQELPDVIVSDIMMPRLDGITMLRSLRREDETSAIPVLFLTARGSTEHEIEGLESGADDYLVKPFTSALLLTRVRTILRARERLRSKLRGSRDSLPETETKAMSSVLERAREVILSHLDEPDFSVDVLSSSVSMSRTALYRRLKQEHGVVASDLIRQIRLEEAAKLLEARAGTVTEVCVAVGFSNLSSFSRAFSKAFGVAPSRYRN